MSGCGAGETQRKAALSAADIVRSTRLPGYLQQQVQVATGVHGAAAMESAFAALPADVGDQLRAMLQ